MGKKRKRRAIRPPPIGQDEGRGSDYTICAYCMLHAKTLTRGQMWRRKCAIKGNDGGLCKHLRPCRDHPTWKWRERMKKHMTLDEWTAEGTRRFGAREPWRYRCPCCGQTFPSEPGEARQMVPASQYALFEPFLDEMISVGGAMCFPFAEMKRENAGAEKEGEEGETNSC